MAHFISTIVVLKTVTLLLGALITFFAFRAQRRTGSPALRALAIGFGLITLGSLVAGAVDLLVPVPRNVALIAESALTALGFGVILYSLYTTG